MPNEQILTVAELKSLLVARFKVERATQAKLQERLRQALGNEVQEEKPEITAVRNKFVDSLLDVLARRLKSNWCTAPLLSYQDFVEFVPSLIDEITKAEGVELEAENRKKLEKVLKAMFENVCELVHTRVLPGKNLYDEYWRWIMIVLDLAAECGILPTELLALEDAADEISRRMFTKEQFVTLTNKANHLLMDADVMKKLILQPILDMLSEGDEGERRELEQELGAEIMPLVREIAEKSKAVINIWLGEEVERIYGAA